MWVSDARNSGSSMAGRTSRITRRAGGMIRCARHGLSTRPASARQSVPRAPALMGGRPQRRVQRRGQGPAGHTDTATETQPRSWSTLSAECPGREKDGPAGDGQAEPRWPSSDSPTVVLPRSGLDHHPEDLARGRLSTRRR